MGKLFLFFLVSIFTVVPSGAVAGKAESLDILQSALKKTRALPASEARDIEEARLLYWLSQYSSEPSDKVRAVDRGMELMEKLKAEESKDSTRLIVWIALKGELAMLKSKLVALSYLKPLEEAALRLKEKDASFGHYAADRILGKLYHLAPRFISIGSRSKARAHFEMAFQGDAGYPENSLFYAEFLGDVGEKQRALELVTSALKSPQLAQHPMERALWEEMGKRILNSLTVGGRSE